MAWEKVVWNQGWSKEDKNRHYYLCKLLRETWNKVDKGSCIDDAITWLEKLPGRIFPHPWKPSEEQMWALAVFLEHGCAAPDKVAVKAESLLDSLHKDLTKL